MKVRPYNIVKKNHIKSIFLFNVNYNIMLQYPTPPSVIGTKFK